MRYFSFRRRAAPSVVVVAPSSCYSVINNINNNIDVKRYHLIDYCKSRSISKAIDATISDDDDDDDNGTVQAGRQAARYLCYSSPSTPPHCSAIDDGLLLFPHWYLSHITHSVSPVHQATRNSDEQTAACWAAGGHSSFDVTYSTQQ